MLQLCQSELMTFKLVSITSKLISNLCEAHLIHAIEECGANGVTMGVRTGPIVLQYSSTVWYQTSMADTQVLHSIVNYSDRPLQRLSITVPVLLLLLLSLFKL